MSNKYFMSLLLSLALASCDHSARVNTSLKEAYGDKFLVGVAINVNQSSGKDLKGVEVIKKHFNSVVAENCMKSGELHPEEGKFDFSKADEFVKFAEDNHLTPIGHCLVWHTQLPAWFCVDEKGNNVTPEVLKARMKHHITTVVSRYKGRVKGWDVVNEAIIEDGSYRKTKFYEILGEEFIPLAFQYAHEADPDAELYYNDYGMSVKGRRDGVVKLIRQLKERGIRIDAVGMQCHLQMAFPKIEDFEESMLAFANEGVKVMITEWDMSALPMVNKSSNVADTVAYMKEIDPYRESLPDSVSTKWNDRMKSFFHLFVKHSDIVTRVTTWCLTDGDSWKNYHPVKGRHDYAALFDRQYNPKPFINELIEESNQK